MDKSVGPAQPSSCCGHGGPPAENIEYDYQLKKYLDYLEKLKQVKETAHDEVSRIIKKVKEEPIFGKKFNYCVDASI